MIIFLFIFLVVLYIYLWNHATTNLMFNKKRPVRTIILIVLFLPIEIFLIVLFLIFYLILFILKLLVYCINIFARKKTNCFDRFLNALIEVLRFEINNYKMSLYVISKLNELDNEYDYFTIENVDLLANYFVSIIRCRVSEEFLINKMKEFIMDSKTGVSVIEWIYNDDIFEGE